MKLPELAVAACQERCRPSAREDLKAAPAAAETVSFGATWNCSFHHPRVQRRDKGSGSTFAARFKDLRSGSAARFKDRATDALRVFGRESEADCRTRAPVASKKSCRDPLQEMQVVVPNANEMQVVVLPQQSAEPNAPPEKMLDSKVEKKLAAKHANQAAEAVAFRAAKSSEKQKAAEAAAFRQRMQRMRWDAAPQLYRPARDSDEVSAVECKRQ